MLRPTLALCGALALSSCDNPAFKAMRCQGPVKASDCKTTSKIPDDQDGIVRWLWSTYTKATDAEIHQAVTRLHGIVNPETLTASTSGTLNDLQSQDLGTVDLTDRDPGPATGLMVLDLMDCTVDQAERITTYSNQPELYPGVYDTYERTYTSSVDDYKARRTSQVAWTIESRPPDMPGPSTTSRRPKTIPRLAL